jgi:hypothetical protein
MTLPALAPRAAPHIDGEPQAGRLGGPLRAQSARTVTLRKRVRYPVSQSLPPMPEIRLAPSLSGMAAECAYLEQIASVKSRCSFVSAALGVSGGSRRSLVTYADLWLVLNQLKMGARPGEPVVAISEVLQSARCHVI